MCLHWVIRCWHSKIFPWFWLFRFDSQLDCRRFARQISVDEGWWFVDTSRRFFRRPCFFNRLTKIWVFFNRVTENWLDYICWFCDSVLWIVFLFYSVTWIVWLCHGVFWIGIVFCRMVEGGMVCFEAISCFVAVSSFVAVNWLLIFEKILQWDVRNSLKLWIPVIKWWQF